MTRREKAKEILSNPQKRRATMIRTIISAQALAGITTTEQQAACAYDKAPKVHDKREAIVSNKKLIGNEKLGAGQKTGFTDSEGQAIRVGDAVSYDESDFFGKTTREGRVVSMPVILSDSGVTPLGNADRVMKKPETL